MILRKGTGGDFCVFSEGRRIPLRPPFPLPFPAAPPLMERFAPALVSLLLLQSQFAALKADASKGSS